MIASRRTVLWALVALFPVNLLAFGIASQVLGGDAWSGRREEGKYFVGNHGTYTQVSRKAYIYSHAQGIAMLASVPIALCGGVLIGRAQAAVRHRDTPAKKKA